MSKKKKIYTGKGQRTNMQLMSQVSDLNAKLMALQHEILKLKDQMVLQSYELRCLGDHRVASANKRAAAEEAVLLERLHVAMFGNKPTGRLRRKRHDGGI